MDKKIEARLPRGMRDILPEQMVRRQYVMDIVRSTFEEYGFEPLITPAMELEEILKGKYGQEAEKLIYSAAYGSGEEKLSLRYDLSVPLCRLMAMYPELPRPFKRYQIAPVWRAERPQKGRFREFYQCDADTVGSRSMLADAETIAVIYTILYRLGFRDFSININNRKVLNGIGQFAGVPQVLLRGLYQAIDKLPKIGANGVKNELLSVGLPDAAFDALRRVARLYLQGKIQLEAVEKKLKEEFLAVENDHALAPFPAQLPVLAGPALAAVLGGVAPGSVEPDRVQEAAGRLTDELIPVLRQVLGAATVLIPEAVVDGLLSLLEIKSESQTVLSELGQQLAAFPEAVEGIHELQEMFSYLHLLGIPEPYTHFDISMVRGLDYYTGPIYETIVKEGSVGSVTGGGRYDRLIGMFSERDLPATGTTIGIERILVVMEERGMFPAALGKTATQVLVAVFNPSLVDNAVKMAVRLRQSGLRTQVYFDADPLREQIGYADKKNIPVVAIIGPDEAAQNKLTLRNLRSKQQETLPVELASETIRRWLADS